MSATVIPVGRFTFPSDIIRTPTPILMQHTIEIRNMTFEPDNLPIAQGDTVVWHNNDEMWHTATRQADPARFDTGQINSTMTSGPVVFNDVGSWDYLCTRHSDFMTGVIVVA